ncbi:Na+/H+ antiporter subunit E [Dasania marina]|uniref:Na+/H+ antiporter subunit E n=1 Tax=Dasania marina TaxID=471499 RepID=UPI0003697AC6|nr:Na+/H+ antiporter subunit E [Dasania marina]
MKRKLPDTPRFYRLTLGSGLFIFWLLLSGQYNTLHLTLGLASSLLVVWAAIRLNVLDWEGHPAHLGLRVFPFWFWLLIKIVQASFHVGWLILRDLFYRNGASTDNDCNTDSIITPAAGKLKTTQKSPLGLATYANSITLTPGTLSISVGKNYIHVHTLTREALNELQQGEMDKRVTRLEGLS